MSETLFQEVSTQNAEGADMKLCYYLLDNDTSFGIKVKKVFCNTIEEETAMGISQSITEMKELAGKVVRGVVTPCTLLCVVDDYISSLQ